MNKVTILLIVISTSCFAKSEPNRVVNNSASPIIKANTPFNKKVFYQQEFEFSTLNYLEALTDSGWGAESAEDIRELFDRMFEYDFIYFKDRSKIVKAKYLLTNLGKEKDDELLVLLDDLSSIPKTAEFRKMYNEVLMDVARHIDICSRTRKGSEKTIQKLKEYVDANSDYIPKKLY